MSAANTEITGDIGHYARLIEDKYVWVRRHAECQAQLRATQMQLARVLEALDAGAAVQARLRVDCEASLRLTGREAMPAEPQPQRRRADALGAA